MYLLTSAWHPYGTLGGAIQAVHLLGRGLLVVNHPVAGVVKKYVSQSSQQVHRMLGYVIQDHEQASEPQSS